LIKDGNDFSGRPHADPVAAKGGQSKFAQKVLREQQHPPAPTLFLGNLSFVATTETIRQMFEFHEQLRNTRRSKATTSNSEHDPHSDAINAERNGKSSDETVECSLKKVRIGTFEDSGVCKGWAFLDFVSTEHATAALTDRRNHSMDGRQLKVEFASPEAVAAGLKHKGSGLSREKPRNSKAKATYDGGKEQEERFENEGHETRPAKRRRSSVAAGPDASGRLSGSGKAIVSALQGGSTIPFQGKKIKF